MSLLPDNFLRIIHPRLLPTFFLINLLIAAPLASEANTEKAFKKYMESANAYTKSYHHFQASDALKEATKLAGAKYPSLHMRLASLYYGLGLIPEAVAEAEKAVAMAPASKWYKFDLAKFYFVNKQTAKAEKQFNALLKLDPGFTLGYFYLAEIYFLQKQYDLAWLSLSRARLLGHQGQLLLTKLSPLTSQPAENLNLISAGDKLFRFIKLSSKKETDIVLEKIRQGNLIENLERKLKKDPGIDADFGLMMLSELKKSVADTLRNSRPYSPPVVIKTGTDFRIMQMILPFNPQVWQDIIKNLATDQSNTTTPTTASKIKPNTDLAGTRDTVIKINSPDYIGFEAPTHKTSEASFSSTLAAFYALESWKDAWEEGNIEDYFAVYSKDFTPPKNMSRTAWEENRINSLTRPKYIRIELIDPVVEMLSTAQAVITFKQIYESDLHNDEVIKALTMERKGGGWKITEERVIKNLP